MKNIHRIAQLLALLAASLGSAGIWAQADEARAKKIVGGVCFVCHGAEGESSSEVFPRLAGQHWEYIAKQLENFKSGKRKSTAMADMVAKLTADEMVALGRFSNSKRRRSNRPKMPIWQAWANTSTCMATNSAAWRHVPAATAPEAKGTSTLPRLAGQHAAYTETQLKQFHQRERTNDNAVMHAIVSKMTPLEMAAVAEYLSGK